MSEFIFTKHALQRLNERSISQNMAEMVLRQSDKTEPGKKPGTVKFIRRIHDRNVQLVGTYLDDQKKWLIVSAWVRGEEDKVPFIWQLLALPFRLIWWLIQQVIRQIGKKK